jgi:hypothetical protein
MNGEGALRKEGWLTKEGGKVKSWKKVSCKEKCRYSVLSNLFFSGGSFWIEDKCRTQNHSQQR